MTINEFKTLIEKAIEKHSDDYYYIGVRFEDKERSVGDICECSKHNAGERDFPQYDTEEYEHLDELDGTSAWLADRYLSSYDLQCDGNMLVRKRFGGVQHAYIVVGDYENTPSDADEGEVVIEDATVAEVLF